MKKMLFFKQKNVCTKRTVRRKQNKEERSSILMLINHFFIQFRLNNDFFQVFGKLKLKLMKIQVFAYYKIYLNF